MKKNIKKLSLLVLALIITILPLAGAGVLAENEEGYVNITYNNTDPTNSNVIIEIEVEDEASGVDKLVYLNGEKEELIELTGDGKTRTGSFVAEVNGDYRFKAYDVAGNETLAKVVITNIFKEKPTLELSASKERTNEDVEITPIATARGEGNSIDKIILPDGAEVSGNEATYTVGENGTYKFTAIDVAGNIKENSITITNINKEKPVIEVDYDDNLQEWTNKDITVTATATG